MFMFSSGVVLVFWFGCVLTQIGHSWPFTCSCQSFLFRRPLLSKTGLMLPKKDICVEMLGIKITSTNSSCLLGHILKETETLHNTLVTLKSAVWCRCVLVKVDHSLAFCGCQSPLRSSRNLALNACCLFSTCVQFVK